MRYILMALSITVLTCCTEPEPLLPNESLDVSGPVYRLNVASVSITRDYISPKRPPNVEYLADISPTEAVRRWSDARLVAAGAGNTLEVDIKDARIVRKDLPRQKTGIEGAFTTEQTEEYDGTLEVAIKIYSPQSALPIAHIDIKTHQSLTLPDNAAPIDRERAYHTITVNLMKGLMPQLDSNIRQYFSNYLM